MDLDGTVASHVNSDGSLSRKHFDYTKVSSDAPMAVVIDAVQLFSARYKPVFLSGREDSGLCRADSMLWIQANIAVHPITLFMREEGDHRADDIIKEELYRAHIEPVYDVQFVFDDRNRVVQMWRRIGLTCFQVADGDF